ncbi:MAG: alpha/beta hydrolase [Actinomycetes bacterium]
MAESGRGGALGLVGAAGAAAAAAIVGAAAGLAAERVVVGRPIRRRTPGALGLGQVRGPHQLVTATDGVQLYVEVDEPGAKARDRGLTVVFVHGYALNLDSWHYQRLGLRGSARLVCYDQRSHGRSGRGSADHATIEQLGRDLMSVLDAVAPEGPVVVVGHSMGGMTVMGLADACPEVFGDRIVGTALIATSAGGLAEVTLGVPMFAARTLRRWAPSLVSALARNAELVERGRQVSNDLAVLVTRTYGFAGTTPVELVDFVLEMINATPVDVLAEFYPAFLSHDALEALDVLSSVESVVIVGEQDKMTPASHSREIASALPDAELVVLDPAGHLVMLERPDDVNSVLFDLLDRSRRPVASS